MKSSPPQSSTPRVDRRTAIKWMLTATAAMTALDRLTFGAEPGRPEPRGYGTDPDLTKSYQAGEIWPLTLTAAQRGTVVALCDLILPADASSPSASAVGVPDFIDEWISAPYPAHVRDRQQILGGLAWLDQEAGRREGKSFVALAEAAQAGICEAICHVPKARPEHAAPAEFFARFRDLAAGGYYTTPEGMKDLGYVGNVPLPSFDGPPPEVLRKVGLA